MGNRKSSPKPSTKPIDQIIQYNTNVTIKTLKGPYVWCSNDVSGYYLTERKTDRKTRVDRIKKSVTMVRIEVNICDALFKNVDFIDIFDETGFLAHYTPSGLRKPYHKFFFELKYVKDGTVLKICYKKRQRQSYESSRRLERTPMNVIRYDLITIPLLEAKGNKECMMCCLESVLYDDDVYVSQCGHVFHTKCLFEYLRKNNYVKPKDEDCDYCEHGDKTIPFPCPVCGEILEDNVYKQTW